MSEREKILTRVREALTVLAPVPGAHHGDAPHEPTEHEAIAHISEWLPTGGTTFDEMVELFRSNSLDLRSDFRLLDSPDQLGTELAEIAKVENWKKIGTHAGTLTDAVCSSLGLRLR